MLVDFHGAFHSHLVGNPGSLSYFIMEISQLLYSSAFHYYNKISEANCLWRKETFSLQFRKQKLQKADIESGRVFEEQGSHVI